MVKETQGAAVQTALLNTDRTLQGRDMMLSVALSDAPTNSRGPVLARGPVCSYKLTLLISTISNSF